MSEYLDAAILVWLVATWFYEGHHRRCTVVVTCDRCDTRLDHRCQS